MEYICLSTPWCQTDYVNKNSPWYICCDFCAETDYVIDSNKKAKYRKNRQVLFANQE